MRVTPDFIFEATPRQLRIEMNLRLKPWHMQL
jgi:hypothetical protein